MKGGRSDDDEYSLNSEEDETEAAKEAWKIRELERVLELKRMQNARLDEFERIEKRRQMTEEERAIDDARLDKEMGIDVNKKEKSQFKAFQKFHHAGAFFQDEKTAAERQKDRERAATALQSERFDKTMLPKSMQVRRGQMGVQGQSKHKSLKDADTTDFTAGWVDEAARRRREKFEDTKRAEEEEKNAKIQESRRMGERG